MAKHQRIYRRTETGRKALDSHDSGLPAAYRQILRLIQGVACADEVLAGMPEFPAKQVLDWLDELDTLCFVESLPHSGSRPNPSELQAA